MTERLENSPPSREIAYRYEAKRYSTVIDPDREEYGVTAPELVLRKFCVVKHTPKGFWISAFDGSPGDRWVARESRKAYARLTKEAALNDYIERKKAYIRHCRNRLQRAKEDAALVIDDSLPDSLKDKKKPLFMKSHTKEEILNTHQGKW